MKIYRVEASIAWRSVRLNRALTCYFYCSTFSGRAVAVLLYRKIWGGREPVSSYEIRGDHATAYGPNGEQVHVSQVNGDGHESVEAGLLERARYYRDNPAALAVVAAELSRRQVAQMQRIARRHAPGWLLAGEAAERRAA